MTRVEPTGAFALGYLTDCDPMDETDAVMVCTECSERCAEDEGESFETCEGDVWVCHACQFAAEAGSAYFSDPFNVAYERARANGWCD